MSTFPSARDLTPRAARAVVLAPKRARQRGFTLVELAVALLAGLIVALAVVGLSKEATNTFHEEMRVATAQMAVRTAIDRLRADVSRASFMATGNVYGDPSLIPPPAFNPATQVVGIRSLAGLRLLVGNSAKAASSGLNGFTAPTMAGTDDGLFGYSQNNGLNPDAIDITGNMNSVDSYTVQTTAASACGAGGTRLVLGLSNPPAYRLAATPGTTGPADALTRAFIPVSGSNFLVRLQDQKGKVQYLEACGVGYPNGGSPFIDLVGNPVAVMGDGSTFAGAWVAGQEGFLSGAQVNPVLTVRYRIAPVQAAYATDLNPNNDVSRFDLYRTYVSSIGTEVGIPELIAEYAVDLKFSLTVDNTGTTTPPPPATTRTHATFPFNDDTDNGNWGMPRTGPSGTTPPQEPQRIRSVRIRLATRAAVPDRNLLLKPPSYTPTDYMYRYCTDQVALASCKKFARVRTVITEVNLNNQARALYP